MTDVQSKGQFRDSGHYPRKVGIRFREILQAYLDMALLTEAAHIHSDQRLKNLAQRIKPKRTWNDLVLPDELIGNLKEIVKMVTHKHIVYNEWGFDRKLSLGKGISALFYGEPGTGKTLASEIIARALEMDLYKIDISTVVSKYFGAPEIILSASFAAAQAFSASESRSSARWFNRFIPACAV